MRSLAALILVAGGALIVAGPASAEVRADGRLGGSGTSLELRVLNTSDTEVVDCVVFQAPTGVRITGASGPGTTSAGGNLFEARGVRLPVGGSAVFAFTTAADYPADQGGTLLVSQTCEPGSDRPFAVDPARTDARIASVLATSRHPTLSSSALGLGDTGRVVSGVNDGPSPAVGAELTVTVEPEYRVTGAVAELGPEVRQVPCTSLRLPDGSRQVSCALGSLRASESFRLTLAGANARTGPNVTTATVTHRTPDFAPRNDTVVRRWVVYPHPDSRIEAPRFLPGGAIALTGSAHPDRDAAEQSSRALRVAAPAVARVEVAILRAGRRRLVWRRASGTTRWALRLPRGLPPGRYVVYSRATNRAGVVEGRFSGRDGNRRSLTVP